MAEAGVPAWRGVWGRGACATYDLPAATPSAPTADLKRWRFFFGGGGEVSMWQEMSKEEEEQTVLGELSTRSSSGSDRAGGVRLTSQAETGRRFHFCSKNSAGGQR